VLGRTTVVPSMLFINEEGNINLYLSIRSVFGTTKNEIVEVFDKLRQSYSFIYSITDYLDPLYVPRNHKFINILSNSYEKITNEKADFILAGGTTYAKALPNSVAFGPIFPGDIDTAHQKNEFVEIENFMKATEIYSLVVAEVILNKEILK
jgi:succinyl-diaminopimelate desuccinylase